MGQVDRIFKTHFSKHFTNHEANFPPSRPIELGAYGVMENGYFIRYGNIKKDFEIDFNITPDNDPSYETFKSEGSVGIRFNAKGDIGANGIPLLKAQIDFSFSSEKSLFFSAAEVKYLQIDNLKIIGDQIMELYKQGRWLKKYVLVSSIIDAGNSIIFISGSTQSNILIEAKSDQIAEIDLTNVDIEFGIKNSSKVSYESLTPKCQIGFSLSRIYNPIFSNPTFKSTKNQLEIQDFLNNDKSIDIDNLVFGNILPVSYQDEIWNKNTFYH